MSGTALPRTTRGGRPGPLTLVGGQVRYALRDLWRTPMAAFFTIVFPLMFLVLIGLTAGNAVIDPATGLRVAQFYTPALLAFAVATAMFTTPANALVQARALGVLKRLRSTPLPAWAHLAGRILAAVVTALASTALLLTFAAVALDVQFVGAGIPQGVVTLLLGIATFGALGFAVSAVVNSSATSQAVTNGSIIVLGFVSEVFVVSDRMPAWLRAIGDVFPLRHFVNGLQDAFDPAAAGAGWDWQRLAVMGAWGVVGAAVAITRFRWQPATPRSTAAADTDTSAVRKATGAIQRGRSSQASSAKLVWGQIAYANRATLRDAGSVFFAVAMPLLLVLLLPAVFGTGPLPLGDRLRFPQHIAPAMAVYGIAVHAFVNVPETMARARELGVTKRLRGTPLPTGIYLAGRFGSILLVAVLILVATVGAGAALYEVAVPVAQLGAVTFAFLLGTAALSVLGFMVAAVVRNARTVPAVTLALLLPLSFLSDIFLVGDLPTALSTIGWLFPLKHFVHALVTAFNPASVGAGFAWTHLGVLAVWGMLGAVVAARPGLWRPRRGPTKKER